MKKANDLATGAVSSAGASFSISSNGPMRMRNNHFGFRSKAPSRSRMVLAALPEGAEGSWGDVDRNYVIGGNWKSNGDFDFVNSFPEEVLAKAEFDPKKVEVVVAPTDLHLTTAQSKLADTNVNVSAQDVSQYGRGAYTGNITAD